MLYRHRNGRYSIGSYARGEHGLVGAAFEDRAAAIAGFDYSIDVLSELQRSANERGRDFYERVITAADLVAAKRDKESGDA